MARSSSRPLRHSEDGLGLVAACDRVLGRRVRRPGLHHLTQLVNGWNAGDVAADLNVLRQRPQLLVAVLAAGTITSDLLERRQAELRHGGHSSSSISRMDNRHRWRPAQFEQHSDAVGIGHNEGRHSYRTALGIDLFAVDGEVAAVSFSRVVLGNLDAYGAGSLLRPTGGLLSG